MKAITDEHIGRFENNLMAYLALAYAALSALGSVFKFGPLEFLTSDPRALVPTIALFLYLLARNLLRVADELTKVRFSEGTPVLQQNITSTHGSMWVRAASVRTQRVWASYLNPGAFKDGAVPENVKEFYKKAEKFECSDYRRVFGIYPDKAEYRAARRRSVEWLAGHVGRTKKLKDYQIRYVELEFQVAEMWIDDGGINYSFPSARTVEAGWSSTDKRAIDLASAYFLQLWESARPIEGLLAGADAAAGP